MIGVRIVTGLHSVLSNSIPEIISRIKDPYFDVLADCVNPRTITYNGEKISVQYVPSGIVSNQCTAIISSGISFDPDNLQKELRLLSEKGMDLFNLKISLNARVRHPLLEDIYIAAIDAQERGILSKEFKICKSDIANIVAKKGLTVFELIQFDAELLELMRRIDNEENWGLKIDENFDTILIKLESWKDEIFLPYACNVEDMINCVINSDNKEFSSISSAMVHPKNIFIETTIPISQDEKYGYHQENVKYPNATAMSILSNIGINPGRLGFSTIGVLDAKTIDLPWCKYAAGNNSVDTIVIINEPKNIIFAYYNDDDRSQISMEYSQEAEFLNPKSGSKQNWKKYLPRLDNGKDDLAGYISQFVNMNYTIGDSIINVVTLDELEKVPINNPKFPMFPYSVT